MALELPQSLPPLVLIDAAASLLTEVDDVSNPEYDRALIEVVTRAFGLSDSEQPEVAALIEGRREATIL